MCLVKVRIPYFNPCYFIRMPGNKDGRVGNGQMAQWVKGLVYKHPAMNSDSQNPSLKNKNTKHVSESVSPGDQEDPRVH